MMNDNPHGISVVEQSPLPSAATPSHPPADRPTPLWRRCLRGLPTLLVFALLAAVAGYGHHTGWSIPKFSELTGNGLAAATDWCDEHGVPESICVECNESLLPRGKLTWCRKHGVHNCVFEHPETAQADPAPVVTQADLDRAQQALDLKARPGNSATCTMPQRRLQLANEEVRRRMGIEMMPVRQAPIVETIAASGEIVFDQTRVAPVSTPVAGRVWLMTEQAQIGAHVKRGDVLALIDAAEVGKAKAELLQAVAQQDLKQKSLDNLRALGDLIPVPRKLEAETALREAHIRVVAAQQALVNLGLHVALDQLKGVPVEEVSSRLHFVGIPDAVARRLDARTTSANLIPVLAARDGVVTAARVVPGAVVTPSDTLFTVTDVSQMWLMLNVRSEDVKYVRVRDPKTGVLGQSVRFRPDGGAEILGELVWKSTAIDDRTRTLAVRAEVPNQDGSLLAHTYGVSHIVLREEKSAIVVPSEAVHWEGDCNIVFVRDKNFFKEGAAKVFHVRTVRPGVISGGQTEIIAGLLPGEIVASRNSAALRAQLLKNNLGAG